MTLRQTFSNFVGPSTFRDNYSRLILDIWLDPSLELQIESNPRLLTKYGFSDVPRQVNILSTSGLPTEPGYEKMKEIYESDPTGNVIFYIPPRPKIDDSLLSPSGNEVVVQDSCCCCCCPCCCCS